MKRGSDTMKKTAVAALSLLAMASALQARAQAWPSLSFSGYGTAGAAASDEKGADYLVDAFKPNGPGHTDKISFKVDSRLGGQAIANLTPTVSAVVQVLLQQDYDDRWRPRLEWANLKWQATDELSVRAGRVVLPVFMVTDSRRIGYANPWVRPPVELYSMVPVTNSDGADVAWRVPVGAGTNTVQATFGRSNSHFPNASGFDAGVAEARRIEAVNDSFEWGPLTARISYGEARLTIAAYRPLFDAFRLFGPAGEALDERYGVDDRRVTFAGLGATYDPGTWFAMAEWARFDTRSIVGRKSAGYVSVGSRLGKLTPYATYARLKGESPRSDPGIPLAGLPPAIAAIAGQANAVLNRQLAALPEQSTVSLGARWDFMRNAALKVQWDRVRLGHGSWGTFGNVQPDFPLGGTVNVYSAAVDFVF
jgi:hypothetical protein